MKRSVRSDAPWVTLLAALILLLALVIASWWLLALSSSDPLEISRGDRTAPVDKRDSPDAEPAATESGIPPAAVEPDDAGVVTRWTSDPARDAARSASASFHGFVFQPDGAPCAAATLWYDGRAVGTTDDAGRYAIEVVHLPVRWVELMPVFPALIARLGRLGSSAPVFPERSQRIDLRLQGAHRVRGTVLRVGDSTPVVTEVHASAVLDRPLFHDRVQCDALGNFSILGLPHDSTVFLQVWAGAEVTRGSTPVRVVDDLDEVTLRVEHARRLRGKLEPWPFPDSNRPARFVIAPGTPNVLELDPSPDGTFDLPIPNAGRSELQVDLVQGVTTYWSRRGNPGQDDLGVLKLEAGNPFRGRVELPLGLPGDFTLWLAATQISGSFTTRTPLDSAGTFVLQGVPQGDLRFWLALDESLRVVSWLCDLEFGGQSQTLEFLTKPIEPTLLGLVRDVAGRPIRRRARVELFAETATIHRLVTETQVDDRGRFLLVAGSEQLTFTPSTWRLLVRDPGFHATIERRWPAPLPGYTFQELVLGEGRSVRGTVVGSTQPLRSALVVAVPSVRTGRDQSGVPPRAELLRRAQGLAAPNQAGSGAYYFDITDATLHFEILGLSNEPHDFLVQLRTERTGAVETAISTPLYWFRTFEPGSATLELDLANAVVLR